MESSAEREARPGAGADPAAAVAAGHRALVHAAGLLEARDRTLFRVTGPRARPTLGGVVTNDVAPLENGRAVYAFALTPKGRPVADLRFLPAGEATWLDVPATAADSLEEHLRRYLPPRLARLERLPEVGRLSLVGPRASAALARAAEALGWPPVETPDAVAPLATVALRSAEEGVPAVAVRREEVEGPGFDLYLPAATLEEARAALEAAARSEGGGPVPSAAYEVWRVERGIPVYGVDMGPDSLPQETGQEGRAISYEKGCYTGQEVVARIHYRGHVNRHLRGLVFEEGAAPDAAGPPGPGGPPDAAGPPGPGAPLYREGREVGVVTSAVRSPGLGAIGLGTVRREVEPGERLSLAPEGPPVVHVRALPFTTR